MNSSVENQKHRTERWCGECRHYVNVAVNMLTGQDVDISVLVSVALQSSSEVVVININICDILQAVLAEEVYMESRAITWYSSQASSSRSVSTYDWRSHSSTDGRSGISATVQNYIHMHIISTLQCKSPSANI